MSIGGFMSIGTRAMFANYSALQVTGNNIANANTKGYSRQQVELQTSGSQFSGAGFYGKGVDVATVTRSYNEFLTAEAASTRAQAAADETYNTQLQQLEKVFPTGENGLGYAAGEVFNAFADVVSKPTDTSARQVVLSKLEQLTDRFRNANEQLDALQAGVTQEMRTSVQQVNALTSQIASLNQKIASAKGLGHTPNELLDQRDLAINELNQYLQVTTVDGGDGTVAVFLGGGQNLVLSNKSTDLVAMQDTYDPERVQLGLREASGLSRTLPNNLLNGGSIAGLIQFQNKDLTDARNQLGQLATAISDGLNDQQGLGLDLTGRAGSALLQVGAPQAFSATVNQGNGLVGVSISDPSQLHASDYELSFDGSNYSLVRLSDQHRFEPPELATITPAAAAAGISVDGMQFQLSGSPQAGDRFLIRPVANASAEMANVMTDPRGIAAAAPVSAALAPNNGGTLAVQSLTALTPISGAAGSTPNVVLKFAQDASTQAITYTVSTDGGATFSTDAQPLVANQAIRFPATGTAQWELKLNGTPKGGDQVSVSPTQNLSGNNGNANALMGLRDVRLVGEVVDNQTGGVAFVGETVTDAYASILSNLGVRVQNASALAKQSTAVADAAKAQQANDAGVNLDEEAARLIQFQQSYQAAAKMLQVAQSVFDTLLQSAAA